MDGVFKGLFGGKATEAPQKAEGGWWQQNSQSIITTQYCSIQIILPWNHLKLRANNLLVF